MNGRRMIALIDMDCFYVQVEQRLQPELYGKPVAVVQHSSANYRGGGILAVSYEAREFGIKRGMFGEQAKALCPGLSLCYVPSGEFADKADITRYRDASAEVFKVLNEFDARAIVERASVDEAYLDLTNLIDYIASSSNCPSKYSKTNAVSLFPTTHIADGLDVNSGQLSNWQYDRLQSLNSFVADACAGNDCKMRLLIAADLIEQIRAKIKDHTSFNCSGGIGSSKMIAKLVCSRHKPGQQTVICDDAISVIFGYTTITDIRNLGGKLGRALMQKFDIKMMCELAALPSKKLKENFPAQADWLQKIARGIDVEPVTARDKQISVAISKNFPGPTALKTVDDVKFWLEGLVKELVKRLVDDQIKNSRTALSLYIGCTMDVHFTRSTTIGSYDPKAMLADVWDTFKQFNKALKDNEWYPPLHHITLSASRFRDGMDCRSRQITDWITKVVDESNNVEPECTAKLINVTSKASEEYEVHMVDDDDDVQIISSKIVNKPKKMTAKAKLSPVKRKKRAAKLTVNSPKKKISDYFAK